MEIVDANVITIREQRSPHIGLQKIDANANLEPSPAPITLTSNQGNPEIHLYANRIKSIDDPYPCRNGRFRYAFSNISHQ